MSNSLEERLRTHSTAFDGLLSLIPAKFYYDEASSEQWQQKKKTKEELKENKRRKLDPDAKDFENKQHPNLTAKELMDAKAKNATSVSLPKRIPVQKPVENPSEDSKDVSSESDDVEIPDMEVDDEDDDEKDDDKKPNGISIDKEDSIEIVFDDEGNEVQTEAKKAERKASKRALSEEEMKKKQENLRLLREKLASKISNLREKRKALGSNATGAPKSREQILEERKRKQEAKKQEKLKRKHEELEEEDSSNSESEEEQEKEPVLFGNIVFNDGSRVTSDLSKLRSTADKKKTKGPANKDIKAHLLKLEQKNKRISKLSPEEQIKQKEKDKWQRLMNQAEGIKVKDDEKLLKKALKRKEKTKLKSEIEWKERKQVVKDTIAAKIKRRDENLKARRENKGKKSKNQVRLKKFTGTVNKAAGKKKRAGFEGSAKSKKGK